MHMDDWLKCYGDGWTGIITPGAFCHPAKFSRALIRRIYAHAVEEGWIEKGSVVIDPFGGVALGGLEAMRRGLHWVGVELEVRFCALAQDNIDLWNKRYSAQMPNWGTAVIVQGDSRRLGEVLARASLCLSSPPYADQPITGKRCFKNRFNERPLAKEVKAVDVGYSGDPANLGNLPDTGFEAALALSSPVYAGGCAHTGGDDLNPGHVEGGEVHHVDYGSGPGQLAQMPEGDLALAISSPPWQQSEGSTTAKFIEWHDEQIRLGRMPSRKHSRQGVPQDGYGNSDGQLAALPEGDHAELCLSSPPYEGSINAGRNDDSARRQKAERHARGEFKCKRPDVFSSQSNIGARGMFDSHYGNTEGQIGKETGSTFWAASRQILEQVYQVLAPGAHAIWVVKAFVRNKAIMDFPSQWRELCESVGFRTLHEHHAILTEDRGSQHTLEGGLDVRQVKRCSFFRRLHESKYPHLAINHEVVLCMVKEIADESL